MLIIFKGLLVILSVGILIGAVTGVVCIMCILVCIHRYLLIKITHFKLIDQDEIHISLTLCKTVSNIYCEQ